jgi:hypothetical protein
VERGYSGFMSMLHTLSKVIMFIEIPIDEPNLYLFPDQFLPSRGSFRAHMTSFWFYHV